jgi:hypothetical protein
VDREFESPPHRQSIGGFADSGNSSFKLQETRMGKWKQQFSIGYFLVALILLFALQSFFASPPESKRSVTASSNPW